MSTESRISTRWLIAATLAMYVPTAFFASSEGKTLFLAFVLPGGFATTAYLFLVFLLVWALNTLERRLIVPGFGQRGGH